LQSSSQRGNQAILLIEESLWIRRVLARMPLQPGMTALDIGSSTLAFRTVTQPYIDRNVFQPLRERGVRIVHLDARQGSGIDIVADVTTLEGVNTTYDLVLCTNLLEHVVDRGETIKNVERAVSPSGLLVMTVPNRYPLHDDPIDTGFRPSTPELVELIGWPEIIEQDLVTVREKAHYKGRRRLRRFLLPWRIACVLARKPPARAGI
jgi:SAM-dependent methyltransferase